MSGFVTSFMELQQLLGICPCCDEVFRLSEARIFVDAPPRKTAFDEVEAAQARLERKRERFEEQEEAIREAATEAGRRAAARRLRRLLPFLARRKVHPQDVKVLFSPVRYVAFPGMHDEAPRGVQFFDPPAASKAQEAVQASLERVIAAGNYRWVTLQVDGEGTVTVDA